MDPFFGIVIESLNTLNYLTGIVCHFERARYLDFLRQLAKAMAGTFIFCVDDHPSMASVPSTAGAFFSHIDIARSGVDAFLAYYAKHNLHSPLMLLRPASDKSCIRSYIGDPVNIFEREIKNLTAEGPDGDIGIGTISKPSDFSYAMSMAFGIINKHRLKNGVDRFGHGRYPWMLEPTTLFIFTNRLGQHNTPFEMENKLGAASDYVTHPYKWDHRVYLFVLQCDHEDEAGDNSPSQLNSDLVHLCTVTGGDVFVVHSMGEARSIMTRIMNALCASPASCAVSMRLEKMGFHSPNDIPLNAHVRLTAKRVREWPIPEDVPVEKDAESLSPRTPLPCLELSTDAFGLFRPGSLTLQQSLQLIKEYDVPHSVYVVRGALQQDLQLERGKPYYVNMSAPSAADVSYRSRSNDDARSTTPALLAAEGMKVDEYYHAPFALLTDECNAEGEESGTRHLLLLPFNFPRILALVQQGRALMRKQIAATTNPSSFNSVQSIELSRSIDTWRREYTMYVQSTPGYYHAPIISMMQHLGLHPLSQTVKLLDYALHSKLAKRLSYAAESASIDIRDMENVSQQKWLRGELVNPPPYMLALASSAQAQQHLPVGPYTDAMPQSATRVAAPAFVEHLTVTWEKMRRVVFGGGSGSFVNGLSVRGVSGTTGYVPAASSAFYAKAFSSNWLYDACGASQVPCELVKEMSNYMHVLARQEVGRDPTEIPDDVADEDSERGVLKRKLENVNFGNRFKKSSGNKGKAPDGDAGQTGSNSGIRPSSLGATSGTGSNAGSELSSLFGDTVRPERDYSQTFMLEEAVLTSVISNAPASLRNNELLNGTLKRGPDEQADAGIRTAADLPALGKPPRRGVQRHSAASTNAAGVTGVVRKPVALAAGKTSRPSTASTSSPVPAISETNVVGSGSGTAGIAGNRGNEGDRTASGSVDGSKAGQANVSKTASGSTGAGIGSSGTVGANADVSKVAKVATVAAPAALASGGLDGWEVQFSAKYNRNYWFNKRTGQSSWEDPLAKK